MFATILKRDNLSKHGGKNMCCRGNASKDFYMEIGYKRSLVENNICLSSHIAVGTINCGNPHNLDRE